MNGRDATLPRARPRGWALALAALVACAVAAPVPATSFAEGVGTGCGRGGLSAAQLDAMFAPAGLGATATHQGFGGGDYPHAYPLPDGRIFWMFQDLHFSNDDDLRNDNPTDVANGTATNAAHNAGLVEQGACFTILGDRGRDLLGDDLTIDGRTWFWPLDGEIGFDGNLWLFMVEMNNPSGTGAGYGALPVRTWLAILDHDTLQELYFEPAPDASTRLYGWSVTSTDQWSYLYSQCDRQYAHDVNSIQQFDATCTPDTYLARVPRGHFELAPQYWTGSMWSATASDAVPIVSRAVANPMSVQWFGDTFVSVTKQDEWWGTRLRVDRAPAPQGPWSTVESRDVGHDVKCSGCGNYGAFLMPWLDEQGKMVVALSNGSDFERWRSNASLYRPTFYRFDVPAPVSPLAAATPPAFDAGPPSSGFVPVDPVRLVDTRAAEPVFGTLAAGATAVLDLRGRTPAGATAVALNLTTDRSASAGWVRAYPCDSTEPPTSNVNPLPGHVVTNAAIVPLGDGRICFRSLGTTDLVVDLDGWLTAGSDTGLVPANRRLLDTRIGLGGASRLPAGGIVEVPIEGAGAGTTAVALSVTAVDPGLDGFVTAWPCGQPLPVVSNLNPEIGVTRPNLVNVRVGDGGRVCLFSSGPTDLVVDLLGEYRAGAGARYATVGPMRLLDTRETGHPFHHSNLSDLVPLGDLVAAQVNLTATDTAAAGYLTAYTCLTDPWPGTSNANFGAAETTAAAALLGSSRGYGCVMSSTVAQLVVDVFGVWR